jgi:hypothetical protein
MSGDYTRFTFDPVKGFSGLLKQQGRVSLDADFNEFEEILDRRSRAEMYDVIGQAVVPETTPHGFEISFSGGNLAIGRGRAYVDGILAECFGDLTAGSLLDPNLNGVHGPDTPGIAYDKQPFHYSIPAYPALSGGAAVDLVYLDVWQREVTMYEDPRLLDVALGGRDTANRVQTAWQVKIFKDATLDATSCDTPPAAWTDFTAPSSARLTADVAPAPSAPGPCVINPAGGYTGLENRLYRVEIQHGGKLGDGTATFKWSRDNASLQATVVGNITAVAPAPRSAIPVDSAGRDTWLQFKKDDTIELLDDYVEFSMRETGTGGQLAKIVNVDEANALITVDKDLSAFVVDPKRHPRIRRWDVAEDGGADPPIRVVDNVTSFKLEDGISVKFNGAATDTLHAGDYWVFSARTADGKIDEVKNQPPRGVLHHYARLALVKGGAVIKDCRTMWPPTFGGDTCCDCSACVSENDFAADPDAIQKAIDQVVAAGGGTVCIGVGNFPLEKGLTISGATSVHVHGVGAKTILWFDGGESPAPALRVENSLDVVVRELTILTLRDGERARNAIEVSDSAAVWVERVFAVEDVLAVLEFADKGSTDRPAGAAIALDAVAAGTTVRECFLAGGSGIAALALIDPDRGKFLVTSNLDVDSNVIYGIGYGVQLGGYAAIEDAPGAPIYYSDRTRVGCNSVFGSPQVGIEIEGITLVGEVAIEENVVHVLGTGILIGTAHCSVTGNDVTGAGEGEVVGDAAPPSVGTGNGIEVAWGMSEPDDCRIIENRVEGFDGAGVWINAYVEAGLVKQNIVRACSGGIVTAPFNRFFGLSIANNQVVDLHGVFKFGDLPVSAGILVTGTEDSEVVDNDVRRIGGLRDDVKWRAGIQAVGCPSVRVAGNEVMGVDPQREQVSVGIGCALGFARVDVLDNRVALPENGAPGGRQFGLLIGPVADNDPWELRAGLFGEKSPPVVLNKAPDRRSLTGRESVTGVRGNVLELPGSRSEVSGFTFGAKVTAAGHCVFADNRCRIRQVAKGGPPVLITAETLALSTNHVLQKQEGNSIEARVPNAHVLPITVLGNLTTGRIMVNAAPLTPNWKPLNVVLG